MTTEERMKTNFNDRRRGDEAEPNIIEKRGVHVEEVSGELWDALHSNEVRSYPRPDPSQSDHPDWEPTDFLDTHATLEREIPGPSLAASGNRRAIEMLEQQAHIAQAIVNCHHPQIGAAMSILWGHREYSYYISKLVKDGHDSTGATRTPLHPDAVEAMVALADLHHQLFDPDGAGYKLRVV